MYLSISKNPRPISIVFTYPVYYLQFVNFTSNVNEKHFFILAEPTVQTNSQNQIVSISVKYLDVDKSSFNAENFVYQTMVEVEGMNSRIAEIGKLWEDSSSKQHTEKYTFTLPTPVALSELREIVVSYQDLIGNVYNLKYH